MTDAQIINEFFTKDGKINVNKIKSSFLDKHDDLKTYLINRFNDSESINETLYRIKNKIEIRPTCLNCGSHVKYINNGKFNSYCSHYCRSNSSLIKNKRSKTNNIRYGGNAPAADKNVVNKMLNTRIERYGSTSYHNIEKYKETMLNKYGSESNFSVDFIRDKIKQTWINNYGVYNPSKSELIKNKKRKTCLERYGVDSYFKTPEFKKYFQENKDWIMDKVFITQKENGTLGKSKIENKIFEIIKSEYPDVIHHYKDKDRYPFNCDFYIPSLDLFIEYNGHWTHGPHSYDPNIDAALLSEWEEKSKTSNFYKHAIIIWTIRDQLKIKIANDNNLNYLILWSSDYKNNKIINLINEHL